MKNKLEYTLINPTEFKEEIIKMELTGKGFKIYKIKRYKMDINKFVMILAEKEME